MSSKVVAIGGVAGTGKTKIIQDFIQKSSDWKKVKPAITLDGIFSKKLNCYVLGKYVPFYEGEGYAQGTDRLSMSVQPHAETFFKNLDRYSASHSNCIFEGDRLFNLKMLRYLLNETNHKCLFLVLDCNSSMLIERYRKRNSNQSAKFIQGRFTKYNNIIHKLKLNVTITKNEDLSDSTSISKVIDRFLNNTS